MLRAAGIFLVALGSIWALQGTGVLRWPAESFMLGERDWAWRGSAMVFAGLLLMFLAARMRRH